MSGKDLPTLSRRLRELRTAAGLSRVQLAVKSGVSMSVIVQVEQGQRDDVKLSTAAMLADALGTTVDSLRQAPEKPKRGRKAEE